MENRGHKKKTLRKQTTQFPNMLQAHPTFAVLLKSAPVTPVLP